MARVKRGNVARNRRKKVLKLAKGFRGSLSKLFRPGRQAVINALYHAYNDRRNKKGDFRKLWITRINAGLSAHGLSYSKFIGEVKRQNIQLNRKMMAEMAFSHPEAFNALVAQVTSKATA